MNHDSEVEGTFNLQGSKGTANCSVENVSPTLSKPSGSDIHAVAIGFKGGQSADGGLGLEAECSPTLSARPSALEPTVMHSVEPKISAMNYDGWNQTVNVEVCQSFRAAMSGTEGDDATPKFCISLEEEVDKGSTEMNDKPLLFDLDQNNDSVSESKEKIVSIDGDKMGKKERKGGSGLGVNTDNVGYTETAKDVHAVAIGVSFDGRKDAPIIEECAHTECVGTNPGWKNGIAYAVKTDMHMGGEVLQPTALPIRAEQEKPGGVAYIELHEETKSDSKSIAIGLNVCTSPRFPDGGAQVEVGPTLAVCHNGGVALNISNGNSVSIGCDRRNQSGSEEVQPSIPSSASDGGPTVAICEGAHGVTIGEVATSVQCEGGKPGQGYQAVAIGFLPTNSKNAHSIGAQEETSPTLVKGGGESGNKPSVAVEVPESTAVLGVNAEPGTHNQQYPVNCDNPLTVKHEDGVCMEIKGGKGFGETGRGYWQEGIQTLREEGENRPSRPANVAVVENSNAEDAIPIDTMNAISREKNTTNGIGIGEQGGPSFQITASQHHAVGLKHIVRRLTPVEAERLQGFPDNYTKIPYRNKPAMFCPDSPRYKALGNSWATNCAEWVLRRIVDKFISGEIK